MHVDILGAKVTPPQIFTCDTELELATGSRTPDPSRLPESYGCFQHLAPSLSMAQTSLVQKLA